MNTSLSVESLRIELKSLRIELKAWGSSGWGSSVNTLGSHIVLVFPLCFSRTFKCCVVSFVLFALVTKRYRLVHLCQISLLTVGKHTVQCIAYGVFPTFQELISFEATSKHFQFVIMYFEINEYKCEFFP